MRILHTSDWHLGARLCERDRIGEHREFLNWLNNTIREESIDLLLISGDIFDSTNPPNSAEALYYEFLCRIKDSGCQAAVVIGGNHDSVSKLNSTKALLERLSVFVHGGAGDSPESDVISISDSEGSIMAVVCAVPFLRERDVHNPQPGESWTDRETSIISGIKDYYKRVSDRAIEIKGDKPVPIIAMGHLFVTGSLSEAGQRDLYVGNLGSINFDSMGFEFSYTALGHIHRSQKIGNRVDIRYSGSPLHMDFGETGEKSVIIADFENTLLTNVRKVQVPVFRQLIRFKGHIDDILMALDNFDPPGTPFWADADVLGGDSVGDINKILNNLALEKGFEFLRIRINAFEGENVIHRQDTEEISDFTVEEVFIKRCEKSEMSREEIDTLMPLYKELIISIQNEAGDYED